MGREHLSVMYPSLLSPAPAPVVYLSQLSTLSLIQGMKKDKVQEISAWDGMESTRPDSSLGREGTSIASPDVALGKAPLGRPVRVWPSSGPQSWVIYIPDVLSTSKCLPRNQELRTNSPRHQRVKGL